MKLKDDKTCHRHDRANLVRSECRFGYCVVMRCPHCMLEAGIDWGPVDCPHKKGENGKLRWYKYPDMDVKPHVAVKKNQPRRRKRSA